jgi:hypothetical protein
MTLKNFLAFCEGFYGEKYSGVFLDVMVAYLKGKPEVFLDSAARVLAMRFSRTHGKAPGPAEIEKYQDEILNGIPKPSPLPDPEDCISDEERERVRELLHNLVKKLSVGRHGQ